MYTNINRANTFRPLSSRPETQSYFNIGNMLNMTKYQKPSFQIEDQKREFGKDITNEKGLTEISTLDRMKQVMVSKKPEGLYEKKIKNIPTKQKENQNIEQKQYENKLENYKNQNKLKNNSNKTCFSQRHLSSVRSSDNIRISSYQNLIVNNEIIANECKNNIMESDIQMKGNEEQIIKEENEDVQMVPIILDKETFHSNPQEVGEYFDDIVSHLRETECNIRCIPNYMDNQTDINAKMRAILVDWLVDVHLKYKLVPETFYLAVNILDRYLSIVETKRCVLQLVGVASMLIASKYEDIFPPDVKEFAYITDKAFTKEEVIMMERKILNTLNYEVTIVTPYRFLEIYKKMLKLNQETFYYAWFLIELSQVNYKMIKYKPSELAASACFIAWKMMKNYLLEDFEKYTGYTEESLKSCSKDICILLQEEEKGRLHAVTEKFSLKKYLEVSKNKFL